LSCTVWAATPSPLRSSELVKQLTSTLAARGLEAVAAQDPHEPDRFIAAHLFPGPQLLIVSARHTTPSLLSQRLAHKQYRDIYLDLSIVTHSTGSWFLQDMQADGLCSSREQMADLLYEGTTSPRMFDADWKKHGLSGTEYERMLSEADQRYSRLLDILIRQLDAG
jgi:hypothetical protein